MCRGGVLLLSGSLQYFDKPYQYLEKFFNLDIPYILVDRIPFWNKKDRIVLQSVSPDIYSASYPTWIFNEDKFFNMMYKKYEAIIKWRSNEGLLLTGEGNINYNGVLFKLKVYK